MAGVILAGGEGRRMSAAVPKPLVRLSGRPLVAWVAARLVGHLPIVMISAGTGAGFESFGMPVVPDGQAQKLGPLAGLDAAARFAGGHKPPPTHLLSVAGDTPFLPRDYVARMTGAACDRPVIAATGGAPHPTAALWPLHCLTGLDAYLANPAADRSIMALARRFGCVTLDFAVEHGLDPFFNVNTPDDLEVAAQHAAAVDE